MSTTYGMTTPKSVCRASHSRVMQ